MPGSLGDLYVVLSTQYQPFVEGMDRAAAAGEEFTAKTTAGMEEAAAAAARLGEQASASLGAAADAEKTLTDAEKLQAEIAATAADAQKTLNDAHWASVDATLSAARAQKTLAEDEALAGDAAVAQQGKTDEAATAASGAAGKFKMLGLAVGAGLGYAVVKASEFQSSLTRLHTQAGVATSQLKSLGSGVLQLAGQVGFSPTSLTEALYHVESSFQSIGITGPKAMNLLRIAAEGAAVGHSDLVDTTNALDAVIASGISGVKNYSDAMGKLNSIVGSGDMTMQDLADAMGTGLMATAKSYGQSINQVGAALATLGDNNIRGAKAATDLRMAWQAVQVPLKSGDAALKALGLTSTTLSNTMTHHGLSAAIDQFVAHLQQSHVPMKDWGQLETAIFGKRAGVGIGVLVDQASRLRSKFHDLAGGSREFGDAWKKTGDTFAQQWKNFRAGLDALVISFGQKLLPAATSVVREFTKFFQFLQKHSELAVFAGGVIAIWGALKLLEGVKAAVGAVAGAVSLIGDAASASTPEVTALDVALDSNVVGIALLAILGLVAGLYELYKHCAMARQIMQDVGRFFARAWQDAMRLAGQAIHAFTTGPLKQIETGIARLDTWWHQHSQTILAVTRFVWATIGLYVKTEITIIATYVKLAMIPIEIAWRVGWGLVKDTVVTVFHLIVNVFKTEFDLISGIIRVFLDLVTGHWSKAWTDLKDTVSKVTGDIGHLLQTFTKDCLRLLYDAGRNLILGLLHGVESAWNDVKSAFTTLGHDVVSWFTGSGVQQGMANAGRAAALGAAQGVESGASAAYSAGADVGASARAGLRDGLSGRAGGIGHNVGGTSQTMAQIGQDLAAKAAQGFSAGLGGGGGGGGLPGGLQNALGGGGSGTGKSVRSTALTEAQKIAKVMQEVGLQLAGGLIRGLEGSASQVKAAVSKLMTDVKNAMSAGEFGDRRATYLTSFLERDNVRLQNLATRRAAILKDIAAAQKYAATTTSSIESTFGIVDAAGKGTAAATPASILASLRIDVTQIRQWKTDIAKLSKMGLNRAYIDQIIKAGPVDGGKIAHELASGSWSQIQQINSAESQINSASVSLGKTAANAMYDSGRDAGRGFLSGLQAQQRQIENMMRRIARVMVDTIRHALGIRSPSTVMAQHGEMAAAGLILGLERGIPGVEAASKRLAGALSGGMVPGGGGVAGGATANHLQIIVQGFVGNKEELARELYPVMQEAALKMGRRNPGTGSGLNLGAGVNGGPAFA